jgi:hypothetical protein
MLGRTERGAGMRISGGHPQASGAFIDAAGVRRPGWPGYVQIATDDATA